jgi:hypothetical protein
MLLGHAVFVGFIVFGLLLTITGKLLNWNWVRNPWFRLVHLVGTAIVVLQAWTGRICSLTAWEMALRERAGDVVYTGSFIAHWLAKILYYHAPWWVFLVCYTVFGSLVLLSWIWIRPKPFKPGVSDSAP